MDKILLDDIIGYSGGSILHQGSPGGIISGISTDSRTIKKTDLFLALCGEKFDGHEFIESVLDKGISTLLISKSHWEKGKIKERILKYPVTNVIGVSDTLTAYQAIAREYLKKQKATKIIITGSNGKTSTKEMLRTILSVKHSVIANEGNLNNQIGVPKTIFTIDHCHDAALIEMGSGKRGDIARLAGLVEPDIGIITSIGLAHTEFIGTKDDIAKEKGDLFSKFLPHSLAILNRDDPYFPYLQGRAGSNIIFFSLREESHVTIIENYGLTGYLLRVMGEKCRFRLGGEHNLINLHFAVLAARHLDMPLKSIIEGIESIAPFKMRSETTQGDYAIIKDCYNANPSSMRAGLDFVHSLSTAGKKIIVLGDMLELGGESESLHIDIGKHLSQLSVDRLFTLGPMGSKIAEGARLSGYPEDQIDSYSDHKSLLDRLLSEVNRDDIVYFKASRALELEKVANSLEDSQHILDNTK